MTPQWVLQRDELKALTPAIIDKAITILDTPEKWTKGAIARNSIGEGVETSDLDAQRFCIVGALRVAARAVLTETNPETDVITAAPLAVGEVAARISLRRRAEFCDALRGTIAKYHAEPSRYEDDTEAALDLIGGVLSSVTGIWTTMDSTKVDPDPIGRYRLAIVRQLAILCHYVNGYDIEEDTTLSDIRATAVRRSINSAEDVLTFIGLNEGEAFSDQIDVALWNDEEGRTYEEVIDLLKELKQ